jgi:outer membrane protein assembly factor BamB
MRGLIFAMLLGGSWAIGFTATGAEFTDPAPPVLQQPPEIAKPELTPHPNVTVHGKPKPLAEGAVTSDWVSFIGPNHNASSPETKLLKKWPEGGPTLLWEMSRGTGYTSPAISGEYLVYLHRDGAEEIVECLHPVSALQHWRFKYPTDYEDRYGYNNGPRSSPVIDGDKVYTLGAQGMLHCLKLSTGQVLWKRDLNSEFKIKPNFFGVGSTPLIEGDLLIVNVGAPGGPGVAAFDKNSGKMVWGADDQWGPSYASPVPAELNGQRRVLVFAGGESRPATGGLLCINPVNGAIDFREPWRSKTVESVNASSPVVIGNQVWVSATYNTGGMLVTVKPDFTHAIAWTSDAFGTHWNTAVEKDGFLYGFDGRHMQNAALVCFNVKTGEEVWRETPSWPEEFESNGQKRKVENRYFRGCLLKVDGHFLCQGELGHLAWMDLTKDGYKELAKAWVFKADETWSLPVVSHGLLYLSQNKPDLSHTHGPRLMGFDLRGE